MYEQLLDRVPEERKVKSARLGLTPKHGFILQSDFSREVGRLSPGLIMGSSIHLAIWGEDFI